jgi:hypothetical protein
MKRMDKKWWYLIIAFLIINNVFMLYRFVAIKEQNVGYKKIVDNIEFYYADRIRTHELNFTSTILNSNLTIESLEMKDSLNNVMPLRDIFKQGKESVLVCRFSERYCEDCVVFSMHKLAPWIDSIGKDNIVFLGTHRSNRVFRQIIASYEAQNLTAYNIAGLAIPVEQIGFPYYFMLDSACRVSNVFIPDKTVPPLCDSYLNAVKERYFSQK